MSRAEQSFDPPSRKGVYLFEIHRLSGFGSDYRVSAKDNEVHVTNVRINGRYIGIDERVELECDDYEINHGTLNITMGK